MAQLDELLAHGGADVASTITLSLHLLDFDHEPGEPTAQLTASIARIGLLEPILVRRRHGRFIVVNGIRRCKALRALGGTKVLAVLKRADVDADVATIVTNTQRSPNPRAELAAMERLIARTGAEPKELARQLGIPYGTVKRRMKLRKLIRPLRRRFEAGEIAIGVAERLSGFTPSEQAMIHRENRDGLTGEVVGQVRAVVTQRAAANIPKEMFTLGVDVVSMPIQVLRDAISAIEALRDELDDDNAKQLAGLVLVQLGKAVGE